ncbi:putative carbonic anhydrase-like protein 2 [Halotydeus destructor]|nr:putative carbonic anhydrase-like protein 2 [Halotydeus destructor]
MSSGTDFWGLLNPDWKVCDKGRRQSPINVQPSGLLYDPHLRTLVVDKQRIKGYVQNNGHSVVFRSEGLTESDLSGSATNSTFRTFGSVNITGGPLSYTYTVDNVQLHFGRSDAVGSEHSIGGVQFPGELGDDVNNELLSLTSKSHHIKYRGQNSSLTSLSISELISDLESFMTYEGSLTTPGCYETVTWIIINKPLIMSRQQFYALRKLMQGEQESPKAPLGNNFRPIQNTNSRVIRTSIDFKRKQVRSQIFLEQF